MSNLFRAFGAFSEPMPEPSWLSSAEDDARIKRAILENEFGGNHASPMQLENAFRRHKANREILKTMDRLRGIGCDSDLSFSRCARFGENAPDFRRDSRCLWQSQSHHSRCGRFGRSSDYGQNPEQFDRVFETKIRGLGNLLEAAKDDPLKYLILFSSVSARLGNKGQSDYAMANEIMNKMARQECNFAPRMPRDFDQLGTLGWRHGLAFSETRIRTSGRGTHSAGSRSNGNGFGNERGKQ